MAIVFPSSPTNGQIFSDPVTGNRYTYDSSKSLWKFSSNNVSMTVGAAPPPTTAVAPGAMWYNTNTGRTFILYDDGDSRQWVENVPAVGSFDSSTVAGYANAASILAVTPAYNTANAGYTVANAAYTNANTKLANATGTLAGALTTTGTITSNGYLYVTPTDAGNEGGEIQISGAGNYAGWALDVYQNNHRTFVRTGSTLANVTYFHALGGSVRMGINKTDPLYTLDVSGTINATSDIISGGYIRPSSGVTFPDGVTQTVAAGYPNFTLYTSYTVNTWYQAPVNLLVTVSAQGSYMNGLIVYAGINTSTYYNIMAWGDDINSNTKSGGGTFLIKKGSYFYFGSPGQYSYAFENLWLYSFALT